MRGIYIHIPFCRQACRYCDFCFSVSLHQMDPFIDALLKEISRKLEKQTVPPLETLYFGGGTPSLLSSTQLQRILEAIKTKVSFKEDYEWTIECNPDDLNSKKVKDYRDMGFNRLSIGIQSFHERDLQLMRRSHTTQQAELAVLEAHKEGFDNITIDLIYGIPGQSLNEWKENIQRVLALPVNHLSAYHLTFEPGTIFDHWRKKGRLLPVPEEQSLEQYRILRELLMGEGFEHYELSNFGKKDTISRHNMLYWTGVPYLGFGPSAHSYDGINRSWNSSSVKAYLDPESTMEVLMESEHLSRKESYHDYLITSLRTRWGADPEHIEKVFGKEFRLYFEERAQAFINTGKMAVKQGKLLIDPEQWLLTDYILRTLFMD